MFGFIKYTQLQLSYFKHTNSRLLFLLSKTRNDRNVHCDSSLQSNECAVDPMLPPIHNRLSSLSTITTHFQLYNLADKAQNKCCVETQYCNSEMHSNSDRVTCTYGSKLQCSPNMQDSNNSRYSVSNSKVQYRVNGW